MRILQIVPGLSPSYGGPTHAVIDLCRELQARGIVSDIATTDADPTKAIVAPARQPMRVGATSVYCFRSPILRKYGYSPGLGRWLAETVVRYDLLHIHGFFSYVLPAAAHAALLAGRPYIVRPLGQLDPWSLAQRWPLKRLAYVVSGRRILRMAAAVHVTSPMELEGLAMLGFRGQSVMIPLGLAMPSRQSSRRKDSGAFRLLFLSRIDAKKGLPVVLRALRAVRDAGTDAVLTVAGSGKPRYLREIERLAEGLGVTSYVRFVGFVSAETKARTLAEADLFVLPSYQENFGLAVAEAMAAGLPVIVSDQVALAPDIETAGAGLVVPCDASDALAAAVLALAADDKRRRAMGDRGRALVEREFAWDRVAREVVRLYETVINWGGAPVGAGG